MGALASMVRRPATKAAGVPSISVDGSYAVAPWFNWLPWLNTRAGSHINEDSALALPTLFACVRVLAESVASLPLIVYRRSSNGGKERATDHPMYDVLHDQPNPEMTSFAWRETCMGHLGTWGNSYNEVSEDVMGRTQIWPLSSARIEVRWEQSRRVYYHRENDGTLTRLKDGTIFHVPGLSMNGLVGLSPVATHRETLGEMSATREFGQNFYRNSARPAVIMEHPKTLSVGAIERLATQMDQLRGSQNAGKTVVAEEGLTIKEIGVPPEDAQYIQTRKLQGEEVCRLYRMPPHMVGILDHATYSNIEQESINFVVHTLRPWLVRIEQAFKTFFFADEPDVFAEFLVDGLLRGDSIARAQALDIQRRAGVLHKNEWRAIENRNPDPEDDVWTPDANFHAQVLDDNGKPVGPPTIPTTLRETLALGGPPAAVEPAGQPAPQPPQLVAVKSAEVRCAGRLATGEPCDKLLGEVVTAPYRIVCSRCKTVAEEAA